MGDSWRFSWLSGWNNSGFTLKDLPFIFRRFNLVEQAIAYVLMVILLGSGIFLFTTINKKVSTEVPKRGWSFSEAIIGRPGFPNPLLAASSADEDIVALVYSGLFRPDPAGGLMVDLALNYSVSDDGLSYTVTLKPNLKWHDGLPVTPADILFTTERIKDSAYKSPLRPNWEGVTTTIVDDLTVRFDLKKAYAPFLENLTVGIIPKHLWEEKGPTEFPIDVSVITPIGTGPFQVSSVVRNATTGVPEKITLQAFPNYALGKPYLDGINLFFYPNQNAATLAYKDGTVRALSLLSEDEEELLPKEKALNVPLSRLFGVFLNSSENTIFLHDEVRTVLNETAPRKEIIDQALSGNGVVLSGPLPPGVLGFLEKEITTKSTGEGIQFLSDRGWVQNETTGIFEKKKGTGVEKLSFTLATANVPDLIAAATILKETWGKVGILVDLKLFEPGDLAENIIRTREYDAVLFGLRNGRDPDPYPFWHSSQRLDPGLNISLYANKDVDLLLEEARSTTDTGKRTELYQRFSKIIEEDVPAIFLYAPSYQYYAPTVSGLNISAATVPSDRFSHVYSWYRYTERVWNIFLTTH